jgi:hypothetical protein
VRRPFLGRSPNRPSQRCRTIHQLELALRAGAVVDDLRGAAVALRQNHRPVAWFVPSLRDKIALLAWLREGGYISRDTTKQRELFGELPTIEETVVRYCRDKGLVMATS